MIERMPEELRGLYAHLNRSVRLYTSLRWRLCPFEMIEGHVPESGVILDVGCGYGLLSNLIALRGKDRRVTGVDLSAKRIGVAQSTVRGRGNIRFVEQDVNDLVLGACDAVIMSDFLHHIPLDVVRKLLVNISEKMAQDGLLIIQDVDRKPRWKSWVAVGIDRSMNIGKKLYHRSRAELQSLLEDIGFCVESFPVHKGLPLSDVLFLGKKRTVKRET